MPARVPARARTPARRPVRRPAARKPAWANKGVFDRLSVKGERIPIGAERNTVQFTPRPAGFNVEVRRVKRPGKQRVIRV